MNFSYDIIVIGAGHAGSEAAAAAANLGTKTLLITMDLNKIAQMSCNPAMGGIAKGQIVREIDALGGYSGIITDRTAIQLRMLNRSKGPAMWSPRAQSDRMAFSLEWRKMLEKTENLDFWQGKVSDIIFEANKITGIKTSQNIIFHAKKVILTAGTFLNGLMHVGKVNEEGGRDSEPASKGLSEVIEEKGIPVLRMKTGTPPRIDGRTIDFSKLTEQKGDTETVKFSFLPNETTKLRQRSCFLTYTNHATHEELKKGFQLSPLFNGTISGIGPRYCPSIEDKLVTFSNRDSHLLFLEPEGEDTIEYYLNGFSSSLPLNVQLKALQKIEGFENVKIFRPAYAIEYDYFDPTFLHPTLESKIIEGLYFAGQVNGTTGYEEAGAQGLIAGINAAMKINKKPDFILRRDQAYIGVLIDDLVHKGVDEPYRMFTSRAEHRILLRQDNADFRLTEMSYKIGLASEERYSLLKNKYSQVDKIIAFFRDYSVEPSEIKEVLEQNNTPALKQKVKLQSVILRPQISIFDLKDSLDYLKKEYLNSDSRADEIFKQAEIQMKYEGYIKRERENADKMQRLEYVKIPETFNYLKLESLSTEAKQKLNRIKPRTVGQAGRIPGVSPSDINVLLVFLGR